MSTSITPVGARVMAVTSFFRGHGGLADEALALDASTYPAPAEMDPIDAAAFLIPYQTAYIGLVTRGGVRPSLSPSFISALMFRREAGICSIRAQ